MGLLPILLIAFGLTAVLALVAVALAGPSATKASTRRLQAVLATGAVILRYAPA